MRKQSKKYQSKIKKHHIIIFIVFLVVIAIFAAKFAGIKQFSNGFADNLEKLNDINKNYNTTIYTSPTNIEKNKLLLDDLKSIKSNFNKETPESFKLLIDFRIKLVESDIYFKEGWKYGKGSTTKYGFGCKGLERLRNATTNRNASSQLGYEAVSIMREFIGKYPDEAQQANATEKDALFLYAAFYKEEQEAARDRRIVEGFCAEKEEATKNA